MSKVKITPDIIVGKNAKMFLKKVEKLTKKMSKK